MKNKVEIWLPVLADAKFTFEKPENWQNMTAREKWEHVANTGEPGILGHDCEDIIQCDMTLREQYIEANLSDYFDDASKKRKK